MVALVVDHRRLQHIADPIVDVMATVDRAVGRGMSIARRGDTVVMEREGRELRFEFRSL